MTETKTQILIVDDDDDLRDLLAIALEREGYAVHQVVNTFQAKKWLADNKPRLILVDVMMPDGNGLDFCRWARARADLQHTPIIVSTGLKDEETLQDALELGADDFLRKPVNLYTLKEKITRAIAKNR